MEPMIAATAMTPSEKERRKPAFRRKRERRYGSTVIRKPRDIFVMRTCEQSERRDAESGNVSRAIIGGLWLRRRSFESRRSLVNGSVLAPFRDRPLNCLCGVRR